MNTISRHNAISCLLLFALSALLILLPSGQLRAYSIGEKIWSYQPGLNFRYKPLLQSDKWVVVIADDGNVGGNSYVIWCNKNTGQFYGSFSADNIVATVTPDFESMAVGSNNVIYAMTNNGDLVAFDDTPDFLWMVQVSDASSTNFQTYGVPYIGKDGKIYVVSANQKLVCVSPQGQVLWRLPFESGLSLAPDDTDFITISQYSDGTLYLGSSESGSLSSNHAALLAVNENGTLKWTYRPGVTSICPPTAFGGGIAFGASDGYVYLVSHSGIKLWSKPFGNGILSAPLYSDSRLWFTRYLFAISTAPPPGLIDQSPVTVLVTNTSGSTLATSRRVSWGGLMTPEPLGDGSAFVSTHHVLSNAAIRTDFHGGQFTPSVAPDGMIYYVEGTRRSHPTLRCSYAGVHPYPPGSALPSTPSGWRFFTNSSTKRTLTWNDVAGEAGYRIEWKPAGSSSWRTFRTPGVNVASARLSGKKQITARYRIRSFNAFGASDPSGSIRVR